MDDYYLSRRKIVKKQKIIKKYSKIFLHFEDEISDSDFVIEKLIEERSPGVELGVPFLMTK